MSKGFSENFDKKQERKIFPRFTYKCEEDADPGFIKLIKDTINSSSLFELEKPEREMLKKIKRIGSLEYVASLTSESNQIDILDAIRFTSLIGDFIFKKIPKDLVTAYLPYNDARFVFSLDGQQIIVQFRGLNHIRVDRQTFYCSKYKTKINIKGKDYIVAFSKHAIDRTCERIAIEDYHNYAGLDDMYSYFELCNYFEFVELSDGSPAFTCWDRCGDSGSFWHHSYAENITNGESRKHPNETVYWRVGYCPIVLVEEYALAKTLLFPGYGKTPEYQILKESNLSRYEKARIMSQAKNQTMLEIMHSNDFECAKWLHENTVPQIMYSEKSLYLHLDSFLEAYM